jgi:hypothetical protein
MMELVDDVRLGPAKLPCERKIARGRELLRAEDQDLRPEKRIPHGAEVRADFVGFEAEAAELSQPHP